MFLERIKSKLEKKDLVKNIKKSFRKISKREKNIFRKFGRSIYLYVCIPAGDFLSAFLENVL